MVKSKDQFLKTCKSRFDGIGIKFILQRVDQRVVKYSCCPRLKVYMWYKH